MKNAKCANDRKFIEVYVSKIIKTERFEKIDYYKNTRCSATAERPGAAGCVIVFAKSRRLEMGDNILRTLQVYLQPL